MIYSTKFKHIFQIGSEGLTLTSLKMYYIDRAYLNVINPNMMMPLNIHTNLIFMISLLLLRCPYSIRAILNT
jgi:hypothetical protein